MRTRKGKVMKLTMKHITEGEDEVIIRYREMNEEVEAIVKFVSTQQEASFDDSFVNLDTSNSSSGYDDVDEEYEDCRDFVIQVQKASASLLQRQFRIGYNKAARIIDQLEANGVIGPQIGSKPREVFIRKYEEEEI